MLERVNIQPVEISHLKVEIQSKDDAVTFGESIPNPDMAEPLEKRYCLASMLPAVKDIISVNLSSEDSREAQNDAVGASRLYTLMHKLQRDVFGGTGLGHGVFYGFNWKGHPFQNTSEAVGYSSLLFTPFSKTDDQPNCYRGTALVVSDDDFERIGLPAGYGTVIADMDFGQVRVLLDDASVAKGVAASRALLDQIGISIPLNWKGYDLIVCESDIKIHPIEAGAYPVFFGVTNINPKTIRGQDIALGFEFWQMIQFHQGIADLLRTQIRDRSLPGYPQMLLDLENQRKLAAYTNGQDYEPLELYSKIQEALLVLGQEYPWVAKQLESVAANFLLNRKFKGTEFRLVVVVKDNVADGFEHSEDGNASLIGGKYPVTAGLMQLSGNGRFGPFIVLRQSTADRFNIDADGDICFICHPQKNALFREIMRKHLVKPSRDIQIPSREKYNLPITTENIARTAWKIYTSSSQIGNLTINYYLSEIANETLNTRIDLSLFYKGIERVIKSAKHKMDLGFLTEIDYNVMRSLKQMFSMPYLRKAKKGLQKQINAKQIDDLANLEDIKLQEPMHYMDLIWNSTLDRISQEVRKLRANTHPVCTFADEVGLNLIPRELEDSLNREIKQIQSLINVWVAIGKGTIPARDGIRAITAASQNFSTVAMREALRAYLSRTTSNGGFLVHLGYGRLTEIFGSELRYSLPERPGKLVRLWSDDLESVDFNIASNLVIEDGIPHSGDAVFVPGNEYETNIDDSTLISALPYFGKDGNFTRSLWAILN